MVGKKKKSKKSRFTEYCQGIDCGVAKVIGVERLLKRNDRGANILVSKVSSRCVQCRLYSCNDNKTSMKKKIAFNFFFFLGFLRFFAGSIYA